MKQYIILILSIAMILSASIVNVDRAQKVAENYYQNYAPSDAKGNTVQKVLTKEYLGQPTWYVFEFTKGFVIVAADDNVRPILGYSFTGKIDEDLYNMNNPFVSKFSNYDKEIVHEVREIGLVRPSQQKIWKDIENNVFSVTKTPVMKGPLLETTWHQNYPFNDQCPTGCPTGSVATAMGQIMRFFQGPPNGAGSWSYIDSLGDTTGMHSVDFSAQNYDWSLMQTLNGSTSSQAEVDELAKFSYHLGVSVSMDYNTDGSETYMTDALSAYQNNWSIPTASYQYIGTVVDSSAYHINIMNEIDNDRPMQFAGSSVASGGHSYVLDGYYIDTDEGDYLYHFNWGWGGSYDGWFQLNDLTPGTSDFTENQEYIHGLYMDGIGGGHYAELTDNCSVSGQDVFLEWIWTGEGDPNYTLTRFEIYRDGELLDSIPDTARNYTDLSVDYGQYDYRVNSIYGPPGDPELYSHSFMTSHYFAYVTPPPPVINLPVSISESVTPGSTDTGDFMIGNTGESTLNYSMSFDYTDQMTQTVEYFGETFDTDLGGFTASSEWVWSNDGNNLDGTPFAYIESQSPTISETLTSSTFDGSGCSTFEFDHHSSVLDANSSFLVEFSLDGGASWETPALYTITAQSVGYWGSPDHQSITLPSVSTTMQIRFTAQLDGRSGDYIGLDNISVTGQEVLIDPWFSFVSSTNGFVDPSLNVEITCEYDATTLVMDEVYHGEITVTSNDPNNPSTVIPVTLSVGNTPWLPILLDTEVSGSNLVLSWDAVTGAAGYNIYSGSDPYGAFTFEDTTTELNWSTPISGTKKFFYLQAHDGTKVNETINKIMIQKPIK